MTTPEPQIDPATLAAARVGDPAAHALLYERFAPMVFTVARRLLASGPQAEDVLQDTFVEIIRSIASFRDEAAIGAWIRRIAINKSLSQLRSGWLARRADVDLDAVLDGRAFGGSHRAETELDLGRLLDSLPLTARIVVWLHDAEGYTHGEIARLMGRSISFSKSQLKRAHDRLRAEGNEVLSEAVNGYA